jgi:hypothetical protein
MTSRLSLVVILLVALGAPVARAAPQDRKAAASLLFEKGIADMQAGNIERACNELSESVATWPDSGAKGALAECDTALGRLSEAWALWQDLAKTAPTAELREDAAKNAAALDQRLVRVVMRVRGTAPATLVVTINGKPVRALANVEPRTEPGTLVVTATSEDTAPWTQTLHAEGGTTLTLEIPLLRRAAVHGRRSRLGLSLIGAGVIGVGVGAGFGIAAASKWNKASEACDGNTERCPITGVASAQESFDQAHRAATISTWSTGIGAAMAAVGLFLYFRSGSETQVATALRISPLVDSQTTGLVVAGSLP